MQFLRINLFFSNYISYDKNPSSSQEGLATLYPIYNTKRNCWSTSLYRQITTTRHNSRVGKTAFLRVRNYFLQVWWARPCHDCRMYHRQSCRLLPTTRQSAQPTLCLRLPTNCLHYIRVISWNWVVAAWHMVRESNQQKKDSKAKTQANSRALSDTVPEICQSWQIKLVLRQNGNYLRRIIGCRRAAKFLFWNIL